MLDNNLIARAKSVRLADLLAQRGHRPLNRQGAKLLYRSPLRQESTPSFWVDEQLNRWKDFGQDGKGDDVIRLVELLDGLSFPDAVQVLAVFAGQDREPSSFLIGPTDYPPKSPDAIRAVKLLENRSLVAYAERRGVAYPLARRYLWEVYYQSKGRSLFALGFRNDSDGYVLRNGVGCKRNIGPADVTTIPGQRADVVNLFEGCFDFLSALIHYRQSEPTNKTVVLNSLTNLPSVLPSLTGYRLINTYFDHDRAGDDAVRGLIAAGLPVADRSGLYAGHNDLNDWLCAAPSTTPGASCPVTD